jgi:predicted O-methyltransferase YrrM
VLFAYALRANGTGRVVALEHEPHFAEATRRMLRERGLADWAEVVDAPLVDVRLGDGIWHWYDTNAVPEGEFDLLVVDGPPGKTGPQARYPALPLLRDHLAPGALIVLDDANRTEEQATAERWGAEFPEFTQERIRHERGTIVLRSPAGD